MCLSVSKISANCATTLKSWSVIGISTSIYNMVDHGRAMLWKLGTIRCITKKHILNVSQSFEAEK